MNDENGSSVYYGVYVPPESESVVDKSIPHVMQDKTEALKLVKMYKKARFKAFSFYHEAFDFAVNGLDCPNNNSAIEATLIPKNATEFSSLNVEKASPFKAPKSQDLVVFRKHIEKGDVENVKKIIWNNPRYLVSNGDTPSILQEGSRYNALHIAARSKNKEITELILKKVSNLSFLKFLYGDDNLSNAEERAQVLLDLYLNTPDKSLNETPLHFAAKYGAAEVVQVLVSYPQCDKTIKNKYGQTPEMIICDRCEVNVSKFENYKKISQLLQDNYYVPVLRAVDNSLPPSVGEPFSPSNPPDFKSTPLSPRLEIQAYAGPMDKEGAEHFRKVWRTPPRKLNFNSPKSPHIQDDVIDNLTKLRFKDPEKGLERLGKTLANKFDIQWKEYWPFLGTFVDIASDEGMEMLEKHLKDRMDLKLEFDSECSSLSEAICSTPTIKSAMSSLCGHFGQLRLDSSSNFEESFGNGNSLLENELTTKFRPFINIEKACEVFANRIVGIIFKGLNNPNYDLMKDLSHEIQQVESTMINYVKDSRFKNVNFQCVHCRIGIIIAYKIIQDDHAESLVRMVNKKLDDIRCLKLKNGEEILKLDLTPIENQLACIMLSYLNAVMGNLEILYDVQAEEDCKKIWDKLEPCNCLFDSKISSRIRRISKLKFDDRDFESLCQSASFEDLFSSDEDFDEDIFYTPPSSPSLLEPESEETFDDPTARDINIFIEGDTPTKTDYDVFNALNFAGRVIDQEKYPNIYLWRHNINLHTPSERQRWQSPLNISGHNTNPTSNSGT